MASIQAIEQTSVHQIQSGQVIVDLNSVVKELVENSLDAGSTSIEVRFRNHGLDAIEVIDNGTGVAPEDFESVALKHHTSKLRNYDDLENLDTFGFRGEALASLCALSQLYIITAREMDRPRGTRLDFEISGKLKDTTTVAAQRGTKVVVEKIFHNLPVRKKELEKNIKREYAKVLTLLQAYACISTGVRFTVSNQMPKGTKNTAFSTNGSAATKDNIIKVFGSKSLRDLVALDLKFEMQPTTSTLSTHDDSTSRGVKVEGHISKPVVGEGRSAPDRQMFYVNSRPCGLPQVAKAFNEVYKTFNITQSPFVFANLIMDTNSYDVNVSPDKRTILLHDQGVLLESLKEALVELFESQEQTVPQTRPALTQPKLPGYKPLTVVRKPEPEAIPAPDSDLPTPQEDSDEAAEEHQDPVTQRGPPERLIHDWVGRGAQDRDDVPKVHAKAPVQNAFDRMRPQRTPQQVAEITIGDKTTRTVIGSGHHTPYTPKRHKIHIPKNSVAKKLSQFAMPGTQMESEDECSEEESEHCEEERQEVAEESDEETLFVPQTNDGHTVQTVEATPQLTSQTLEDLHTSPIDEFLRSTEETDKVSHKAHEVGTQSDQGYLDEEARRVQEATKIARMMQEAEDNAARSSNDIIKRATQALRASKHKTLNLSQVYDTSTTSIAEQATLLSMVSAVPGEASRPNIPVADDIEHADAEARLSLTVSKSDFGQMDIIGQFNLGFILAVRPPSETVATSDLFIIDQHAADEKYNFELFTDTLTLEPQRLAQPKQLELTAIEEEIVLAHTQALTANGFVIETDTSGASDVGLRCKLLTLPTSKGVTFDLSDLEELLHLLSDHSGGVIPRPAKVRKMLAMRACRASIMVGKPLKENQMLKVVRNLGEMDKPWNCPHGRPTMRHLADLSTWGFDHPETPRTDWKGWIERVKKARMEEDVSDEEEERVDEGEGEEDEDEEMGDDEEDGEE
ncbi:DNA mismatch repair protein MutL [Aureobasidium sp. EXF-10727]|nr:DNA mismatch repair protein MutL [Aureobasidium sp. EXF-10727]